MKKRFMLAAFFIALGARTVTGWTTNYYIDGQTTVINDINLGGNDYGIVMVNNSDVTNNAAISAAASGIFTNDSILKNNAAIISVKQGIEALNSKITNNSGGSITAVTGVMLNNSELENFGSLTVLNNGMGINADNSIVKNYGSISGSGNGIVAYQAENGTNDFLNEGNIDVSEIALNIVNYNNASNNAAIHGDTGLYSYNNYFKNSGNGEIKGDKLGVNMASSTLENSGKIIGSEAGIYSENSDIINYGNINGQIYGLWSKNDNIFNESGNIFGDDTGITMKSSDLNNKGDIAGNNNGIISVGSKISNYGTVSGKNTGILSNEDTLLNDVSGSIESDNTALKADSSVIKNNGTIDGIITAVYGENSNIMNNGSIKSSDTAVRAVNGQYLENAGKIESSNNGVEIVSGVNLFSNHFKNSGNIYAENKSVKFYGENNVLELSGNSDIKGNIDGGTGENILILNGNINLNDSTADNFNKLVAIGNTVFNGTVNLSPSNNSSYYTETFASVKDLKNISSDSSVGEITISGIVNIGVDYDNISNETDKTGKIIANGIKLINSGNIVLVNGGRTTENIIEEAKKTGETDKISIKSIIISNKQQAVNPDFKFGASNDLEADDEWERNTVARIENGVTVLDEVYTKKTPEKPDSQGNYDGDNDKKINSVPRNRVDLDNLNKMDSIVERFTEAEIKNISVGDHQFSVEYTGNKFNSDFKNSNVYNYDYDTDSNGVIGKFLHRQSENLYAGFALYSSNNNVNYSNNDKETIDSLNAGIFGKYIKDKWDFGAKISYGYNKHDMEIDWAGLGAAESNYDSHVFKAGMSTGYSKSLFGEKISVRPNIGVDYTLINEGTIRTKGMSDIESAHGNGFTGILGIDAGNIQNEIFRWNAGIEYKYNFTDTFHNERNMSNNYYMEQLDYNRNSLAAHIDLDISLGKDFKIQTGYEYEYNKNYKNHNIKAGLSYLLR